MLIFSLLNLVRGLHIRVSFGGSSIQRALGIQGWEGSKHEAPELEITVHPTPFGNKKQSPPERELPPTFLERIGAE